jgi:hypothetical protein
MFALPDMSSLYTRMMLGVCAVLTVVILGELTVLSLGRDELSNAAAADYSSVTASDSAAVTLQIPPPAVYGGVLERPLFADSRRPPQLVAQATESARAVQLGTKWKVTGIAVAGDSSFVHVEGIRDRKTVRLQVGMPLDGWTLQKIEPGQIVFGLAGESVTLQLHEDPAETAK